jgi:hypothetical protein
VESVRDCRDGPQRHRGGGGDRESADGSGETSNADGTSDVAGRRARGYCKLLYLTLKASVVMSKSRQDTELIVGMSIQYV